jgi:predicted RNase H-like HicB family nuclease
MSLTIITQQESDGRWIAEVPSLKGVMVYGDTREEAIEKVKELGLLVVEDRIEHRESLPAHSGNKSFVVVESSFDHVTPARLPDALLRSGWVVKRETANFKVLSRHDYPDFIFAFGEDERIRVRMFDWIVKATGPVKDL